MLTNEGVKNFNVKNPGKPWENKVGKPIVVKSKSFHDAKQRGDDRENCRVFLRHIPLINSWNEIYHYLIDGAGLSAFVKLHFDEASGDPLGHGLLSFHTPVEAAKAVKFIKSHPFKGVQMEAMLSITNFSTKKKNGSLVNKLKEVSLKTDQDETYGLSMPFLKSLGIRRFPLINAVLVHQVPLSANEMDMRKLLSIAGSVINVNLLEPDHEIGTRSVYAEYSHPLEAVQSISMLKNQIYRGRQIVVVMYNVKNSVDPTIIGGVPDGLESVGAGLGRGGAPLEIGNSKVGKSDFEPVIPKPFSRNAFNKQNHSMDYRGPNQNCAHYGRVFNPQSNVVVPSHLNGRQQGADLYITNLPLDFTDGDLYKLSWNCGEVTSAEMRSPGCGLIKFPAYSEAVTAAKIMNQRPLEGKIISARLI